MKRMTLVALVIGTCLPLAASAKADPQIDYLTQNGAMICAYLEKHPNGMGVAALGQAIVDRTGWEYRAAGQVIRAAVVMRCPERLPALLEFQRMVTGQ